MRLQSRTIAKTRQPAGQNRDREGGMQEKLKQGFIVSISNAEMLQSLQL